MAGPEHVEIALAAAQESARPVGLFDPAQSFAPTGEGLVSVGLVADVPDDAIPGCVEYPMERDSQLDGAEASREVSAALRSESDQVRAQRAADGVQPIYAQAAQIAGLTSESTVRIPWE